VDFGSFGILEFRRVFSLATFLYASSLALLYFEFPFRRDDKYFASYFPIHVCPAIAYIMVASSCTCAMLLICLLLYHILCVADPSWSLYSWFLICYHLPCYYFRSVSYMLPFNTCISPDHLVCYHLTTWHATTLLDPLVMSWLTRTISISLVCMLLDIPPPCHAIF